MAGQKIRLWSAVMGVTAILIPWVASATVITVRSDGSGDYPSVTAAVAASSAGDSIEVGPGTYTESGDTCSHALTIYSTAGAAATTLDGQLSNQILRFDGAAVNAKVVGLRFFHGYNPNWSTLGVINGGVVTVEDCIFEGCQNVAAVVARAATAMFRRVQFVGNGSLSLTAPGAVYVSGDSSYAMLIECEFVGNRTGDRGGVVVAYAGGGVTCQSCVFSDNYAFGDGAAVYTEDATDVIISGCLFEGNVTWTGSTVYCLWTSGTVTECTFYNNVSAAVGSATLLIIGGPLDGSPAVSAERDIFVGQVNGNGLGMFAPGPVHRCNIYWDNSAGPILNDVLAPDEVVADPVFCDAAGGDFHVSTLGPAARARSACGQLIGAFPTACDIWPTGVGDVPIAYRLDQNEPNPFNPSTVIPYGVGIGGGRVTLRIYDVSGRLVRTLVDGVETPGPKVAPWDGVDDRGRRVASGVYFYKLIAPGYEKTLKMTIVK